MSQSSILQQRQEHCRRAHWFGAEAVILEKEAEKLLSQARIAKGRYFSELAKADQLGGIDSPFEALAR